MTTEGSETVLQLAEAALTDAIDEGDFSYDANLRLDTDHILGLNLDDPNGQSTLKKFNPYGPWKITKGDLTYNIKLEPSGQDVKITLQVDKKAGANATGRLTGVGTIKNFRSKIAGAIKNKKLSSLDLDQKNLEADVNLDMAAVGPGNIDFNYTFPGLMFKHVVFMGPIPVTLGINVQLVGRFQLTAEASATAKSHYTYKGDSGFTYNGTTFETKGKLGNLELNPEPADSAANIGNAVDLQFGFAFPQVSVSFFEQLLIPYVHTTYTAGSSLSWGPLCKRGYVKLDVVAGYDFKVLGNSLLNDKLELVTQKKEGKGDGCP